MVHEEDIPPYFNEINKISSVLYRGVLSKADEFYKCHKLILLCLYHTYSCKE